MSIDVKCNKCGSTYSVTDKLSGGSVRCAKCRAPIHVPIVRQPPQPQLAASPAEAAAAADLDFDYSPNLSPAAAASMAAAPSRPAPAPSPPAPAAPPPLPSASGSATPAVNAAGSSAAIAAATAPSSEAWPATPVPASLQASATSAVKFKNLLRSLRSADFDFRFRNYWSGSLAWWVWILALSAAAYLGYTAIAALASLAKIPAEMRGPAEWMIYGRLFLIGAGLALLRIALEAVSALFSIAKLLREVRDELRNRP